MITDDKKSIFSVFLLALALTLFLPYSFVYESSADLEFVATVAPGGRVKFLSAV